MRKLAELYIVLCLECYDVNNEQILFRCKRPATSCRLRVTNDALLPQSTRQWQAQPWNTRHRVICKSLTLLAQNQPKPCHACYKEYVNMTGCMILVSYRKGKVKGTGKGKVVPVHATKAYGGVGGGLEVYLRRGSNSSAGQPRAIQYGQRGNAICFSSSFLPSVIALSAFTSWFL
jgi:hypothetical protein